MCLLEEPPGSCEECGIADVCVRLSLAWDLARRRCPGALAEVERLKERIRIQERKLL